MTNKRVMIEQCRSTRRTSLPNGEIEGLAENIRDTAMRHPVLLIEDTATGSGFIVVDGLARIEAASKLGHVTIESIVATDLDQACKLLAKVNRGHEIPYHRMFEISEDLAGLLQDRKMRNIVAANRGLARPAGDVRGGADLLADALGVTVTLYKRIRDTFRQGQKTPEGLLLLQELRKGHLTINMAYHRIRKSIGKPIPKTGDREEPQGWETLLKVARTIGTAVRAGESYDLDWEYPEQSAETIKSLRESRTVLSRLIWKLEKGTSSG